MYMECLKIKCPVCGKPNEPISFSAEQGQRTRVQAEYECRNIRKRLFRARKPCEIRYRIEWNGQAAERIITELGEEGKRE